MMTMSIWWAFIDRLAMPGVCVSPALPYANGERAKSQLCPFSSPAAWPGTAIVTSGLLGSAKCDLALWSPQAVSTPAGLQLDLGVVGEAFAGHGGEESALPLADRPDLVEDLAGHLGLADEGLELPVPEVGRNGVAVHRTDRLDRLREHLEHRVVERAAPVVGVDVGDGLVALVEIADVGRVGDPARSENVLGGGPVLLREALEGAADGGVIGLDAESFDL